MTTFRWTTAAALAVPLAMAQTAWAKPGDPITVADGVTIDPIVEGRLRYEHVDQPATDADALTIATIMGLAAGSVNTALALGAGYAFPHPVTAGAAGLVGFLGYGDSLVLFVLALREIGAARTGAYFSTAPFVGAVIGLLLLREPFTGSLAAAGLLMGFGVYLHLTESHAKA